MIGNWDDESDPEIGFVGGAGPTQTVKQEWKDHQGWWGYHIQTGKLVGPCADEVGLLYAMDQGTAVAPMTEDMLRQGLITGEDGNVLPYRPRDPNAKCSMCGK